MDSLADLTLRIPAFAGYATEDTRRLSDEQVRSYLGEALANLQARLELEPAPADALEALILRCEFANQTVYRTYGDADLDVDGVQAAKLAACDARVVELADCVPKIDAGTLGAFIADANAALDARDTEMESLTSTRG